MTRDELKLGLYYSSKYDAIMEFSSSPVRGLVVVYAQWCPEGTFSKHEGYYYNFGQLLTENNFSVIWEAYQPEYFSDMTYMDWLVECIVPLTESGVNL